MTMMLLVAGIAVGHQFYSRAEMVVVGFHSHWLNGIDYMGQSYSKGVMTFFFLNPYVCVHIYIYIYIMLLLVKGKKMCKYSLLWDYEKKKK